MRCHWWLCFMLVGLLPAACVARDEVNNNDNDMDETNILDGEEKSAKLVSFRHYFSNVH